MSSHRVRESTRGDSEDTSRHIFGLHRKVCKARTAHERTVIERDIAATDGRIDRLVYELYGLTEKERRIVDEGTLR